MKEIIKIVFRLLLGFLFCAFGTVLAVKSNLGLSPWDVFHQGVSNITGLTIGRVSIAVALVILFNMSALKHRNIKDCILLFNKCIN